MRVQDIMTSDVQTVPASTSVERARERMRSRKFRHLVVTERKAVVGLLSDRDLGRRRGRGLSVEDVMTPHVVTAKPRTTIRQAANLLRGRNIGCLPVLDGERLVGIVTVSDLLELVGRGVEKGQTNKTRPTLRHHRGPRQRISGRSGH